MQNGAPIVGKTRFKSKVQYEDFSSTVFYGPALLGPKRLNSNRESKTLATPETAPLFGQGQGGNAAPVYRARSGAERGPIGGRERHQNGPKTASQSAPKRPHKVPQQGAQKVSRALICVQSTRKKYRSLEIPRGTLQQTTKTQRNFKENRQKQHHQTKPPTTKIFLLQ